MDRAAIDRVLDVLLADATRDRPSPASVTFLLREYVAVGHDAVRDAAEQGLARGLALLDEERDACARVQWLRVFAEAASSAAGSDLASLVQRALPDAIDGLESYVRRTYEPGEGLAGAPASAQIACASAMLAAFDLAGRLPYAMLAEELLTTARRQQRAARSGPPRGDSVTDAVAASVCCRLAALHADPDYLTRAVVAPRATYREDARQLLAGLADEQWDSAEGAAEYGVSLFEWFALEAILQ